MITDLSFGKAVIYAGNRTESRGDIQIADVFSIPDIISYVKQVNQKLSNSTRKNWVRY